MAETVTIVVAKFFPEDQIPEPGPERDQRTLAVIDVMRPLLVATAYTVRCTVPETAGVGLQIIYPDPAKLNGAGDGQRIIRAHVDAVKDDDA